jgi:hypothetical protein
MDNNKKEFYKKLSQLQQDIKAPKNKKNTFGNYSYRSCEDVMQSFKQINKQYNFFLSVTDEIINIGDRYYIKATAKITDGENIVENVAYAREDENKKGMDLSQLTGACSSYARKYALNGLFCLDDTKDPDTDDFQNESQNKQNKSQNKQNESVFDSTLPPQTKKIQFDEPSERLINEIKLMINMLSVDELEKKEIVKNYTYESGISKNTGKKWERYITDFDTLKNNFGSFSNIKIYNQLNEKLQTHL